MERLKQPWRLRAVRSVVADKRHGGFSAAERLFDLHSVRRRERFPPLSNTRPVFSA
jgi:hypothetical protein